MELNDTRHQLFVEGPDDGSVVNAIVLDRRGLDLSKKGQRVVKVATGWSAALEEFRIAVEKVGGDGRIGLLLDRDGGPGQGDRWTNVRDTLRRLGYEVGEPRAEGWFERRGGRARVGVWLMPDNVHLGDLETFLEALLPVDRSLWDHSIAATTASKNHGSTFLDKDERKARLHAWTAWLDEPGGGYGLAIKRKNLGSASPAADAFVAWFKALFLDN